MNTTEAPKAKSAVYFPGKRDLTIVFLVLLGVAAYFFFEHPTWWWGRIGSIIALVTVVLMLFRDWLHSYGEAYENKNEGNAPKRIVARFLATAMTSIGAALLVISAWFQLQGDPVMVIRAPSEDIVFKATGSKGRVDGKELMDYLNSTYDSLKRIDGEITAMWHLDLVIVNCGSEHGDEKCGCPASYTRVRYVGKWDLNAGATGDGITLCYKQVPFKQSTK